MITGGKRVEVEGIKGGFYYAPTIFVNVKNKMRIAQEEIFGPVVGVMKFDSDEEAVAIANDTMYGLGGGVFSSNTARAERVARGVRTGTMWINNYHAFGDFCPFGGYKQSGVGREFGLQRFIRVYPGQEDARGLFRRPGVELQHEHPQRQPQDICLFNTIAPPTWSRAMGAWRPSTRKS